METTSSLQHQRAAALFEQYCDLPATERAERLAALRVQDPTVHDAVIRLLAIDAALQAAREGATADLPRPASPTSHTRLGPYTLLRRLGAGGFGEVWLAEQSEPIRRAVAIKIVLPMQESRAVLARFERERQALAVLDHPNIARIFDMGATDDGRPYFVMEYVQGLPIDKYCDGAELTIAERLRLFQKVCSAVQYAHQNLIVHCDIKPLNILVSEDGEPKLLDFGIARILNPHLGSMTIETEKRPLTPAYASPEQVLGQHVGAASDIYSLGVLLYELLTGRRPYRLGSSMHDAVVKAVVNTEPERPSFAVTHDLVEEADDGKTRTRTAAELARPRSVAPGRLRRLLAGDIDNIVLMAMRKNPRRRYGSAQQLAEDIRRHLEGEPVVARSETWVYVAGKFARRNRAAVVAAGLVLATLVGGIVSTRLALGDARVQRDKARAQEQLVRVQEERTRESIKKFLGEFSSRIRKAEGSAQSRALLARTALEMLGTLQDNAAQPGGGATPGMGGQDPAFDRLMANALIAAGDALGGNQSSNLGDSATALKAYRQALDLRRALASGDAASASPDDQRALAVVLVKTAGACGRATSGDLDPLELLDQARKLLGEGSPLSTEDPEVTRLRAKITEERAFVLDCRGRSSEAEEEYRQALGVFRDAWRSAKDDPDRRREYSTSLSSLADCLARNSSGASLADIQKLREEVVSIDEGTLAIAERPGQENELGRARRDAMLASGSLAEQLLKSYDKMEPAAHNRLEDACKRELELAELLARNEGADETRSKQDLNRALRHDGKRLWYLAADGAEGEGERAKQRFGRALTLAESLYNDHRTNLEVRSVLADTQCELGALKQSLGETEDAVTLLCKSLGHYRAMAAARPDGAECTQLAAAVVQLLGGQDCGGGK